MQTRRRCSVPRRWHNQDVACICQCVSLPLWLPGLDGEVAVLAGQRLDLGHPAQCCASGSLGLLICVVHMCLHTKIGALACMLEDYIDI
jgi:hypothetical protein